MVHNHHPLRVFLVMEGSGIKLADEISLKDALQSFGQGVSNLGFAAALDDAQNKITEVKASGLKAGEQRRALAQVTQGLVMDAARFGRSAAEINQIRLGITGGETMPQSAAQMTIQGIMSGDEDLQKSGMDLMRAQTAQAKEIRGKSPEELMAAKSQQEQKRLEKYGAEHQKFVAKFQPALASARSLPGMIGKQDLGAKDIETVLGTKTSWNTVELNDAAVTLARTSLGGVPGESTIKEFNMRSWDRYIAEIKQMITGIPEELKGKGPEAWANAYRSIAQRLQSTGRKVMDEAIVTGFESNVQLPLLAPDRYKEYVAETLGISPSDIEQQKSGRMKIKANPKRIAEPGALMRRDGVDEAPAGPEAPSFFRKI